MSAVQKTPINKMTLDQFRVWSEGVPGRYELHDGDAVEMQSERTSHARVKGAVYKALGAALAAAGKARTCEALPDGMPVPIDDRRAYEPDALVYCGERNGPDDIDVLAPVIVVEVLSLSTSQRDLHTKLIGYFSLPSVVHYLIFQPDQLPMVHHARQSDATIHTRIVTGGILQLDPPGISLDIDHLWTNR